MLIATLGRELRRAFEGVKDAIKGLVPDTGGVFTPQPAASAA